MSSIRIYTENGVHGLTVDSKFISNTSFTIFDGIPGALNKTTIGDRGSVPTSTHDAKTTRYPMPEPPYLRRAKTRYSRWRIPPLYYKAKYLGRRL